VRSSLVGSPVPFAMQKVMGSSSIIRFVALRKKSPKRVCLASACLIA
jgi:hypothetical protein